MNADLSTWLTKQQAADAMGVSTKAVERFTRAGKLQQAFRAQAGSPHVAVYEPSDVARLAAERQPDPLPAFLVPTGAPAPSVNGNGHGPLSPITPIEALERVTSAVTPGEDFFRVLVAAAGRVMSETSQTSAYVDKAAALAIAGVSYGELREAVRTGEVKQRGRKYRRKDLEAL